MVVRNAINHFIKFHTGTFNIVLHVLGFLGVFYSIYVLGWWIFAISLIVLETGHVYNHFAGIEEYDLRPHVLFWRITIFILVVAIFFFVTKYLF